MKVTTKVQDLFKQACTLTAIQGKPARDEGGVCLYLDPATGNKCAVGQVLPDGHPSQLVRWVAGDVFDTYPDIAELFGVSHQGESNEDLRRLWGRLQAIHDDLMDKPPTAEWPNKRHATIRRPFGIKWGEIFWARARTLSREYGFDIGNYPRAAINEARAA